MQNLTALSDEALRAQARQAALDPLEARARCGELVRLLLAQAPERLAAVAETLLTAPGAQPGDQPFDDTADGMMEANPRLFEAPVAAAAEASQGPLARFRLTRAVFRRFPGRYRERMLEVVLEVEQRPLSSFGCDGVWVSTATGSTAYAFSAGGPVVWPNVDAFVVVPISAHALFSRPFVIDNDSSVAIEVLQRSHGGGVMSCDGRRTVELSPGARVEITRGSQSVEMVTLTDEPFADRLVRKFNLPVTGWRGPGSDD